MEAGTRVPENSLTSYDSLDQVIKKFNAVVGSEYPQYCVDEAVVKLRDMLAHGRVFGISPNSSLKIVKFGKPVASKVPVEGTQVLDKFAKPTDGGVPVEAAESLDDEWYARNVRFTAGQLMKVANAYKAFGQTCEYIRTS